VRINHRTLLSNTRDHHRETQWHRSVTANLRLVPVSSDDPSLIPTNSHWERSECPILMCGLHHWTTTRPWPLGIRTVQVRPRMHIQSSRTFAIAERHLFIAWTVGWARTLSRKLMLVPAGYRTRWVVGNVWMRAVACVDRHGTVQRELEAFSR
jgi:hypothetical protein